MFLIVCIIIFICAEHGRELKGEAQGMEGEGGLQDQDRGFYSTLLKTSSNHSVVYILFFGPLRSA